MNTVRQRQVEVWRFKNVRLNRRLAGKIACMKHNDKVKKYPLKKQILLSAILRFINTILPDSLCLRNVSSPWFSFVVNRFT